MENDKPDDAGNLLSAFVPTPTDRTYEFGANLRSYIKGLFEATILTIHQRAAIVGYRNINKFHKREGGYLALCEIPRVWFEALNGDYEILQAALQADQAAFDHALENVQLPTRFTMRVAACLYPRLALPAGLTTEAEIVEYVAQIAKERDKSCNLSLSGLKSYWFRADGSYVLDINRPILSISATSIVVGNSGFEPHVAVGR